MDRWKLGSLSAAAGLVLTLSACQKPAQEPVAGPSEASAPASASASATAAAPLQPGQFDKILQIRSDDGKSAISAVLLDGIALKTEGLGSASVKALLAADPDEGNGTPCEMEGMEVHLANGVVFRPLTNVCQTAYVLRVPAARAQLPEPAPSAPEELSWQTDGRGSDKMLYFGVPETDATAFLAECRKDSGRTMIKFFGEAGGHPVLDLYAPDHVLRYELHRSSDGSEEEAPTNSLDLAAGDIFWTTLKRGGAMPYRLDGGTFLALDTRRGSARIQEFLNWCSGT